MRQDLEFEPHSAANTERRALLEALLLILLLAGLVLLGYTASSKALLSPQAGWFVAGGLTLLLIYIIKQALRTGWLAAPIVYMIVVWVFHFGLIFPAAVAPSIIALFPTWGRDWLFVPETSRAILMSMLFLVTLAIVLLLFFPRTRREEGVNEYDHAPELVAVGWLAISVGLVQATIGLVILGFGIFFEGYETFYPAHNTFSWPIVIIATGLMLQIAGGRSLRSILLTALWAYVPLSLLVVVGGSRTAFFFSAVALFSMAYERGLRVSRTVFLVGALLVLVVTSTVKNIRQFGVAAAVDQQRAVAVGDPLTGLIELGGSLRPVTAVVDYSEDHEYFLGETFAFPFIRQIERFTGTRKSVLVDQRFIAAHINRLYGSIGFSVVAEGYINGGPLGVALVAVFWGMLLGVLMRFTHTPYGAAVLAVTLIPMLISVRNSFIFVPVWIALGLALVVLAAVLVGLRTDSHPLPELE